MIAEIKNIWNSLWQHKRALILLYALRCIGGIIFSWSTACLLSHSIGYSTFVDHLVGGFHRTVFMDMIYTGDNPIPSMLENGGWIIMVLFFFSLILQSGLLHNIHHKTTGINTQIRSGMRLFFPFLLISVVGLLVCILLVGGLLFFAKNAIGDPLITFYSEKPFVYIVIILILISLMITALVWGWIIAVKYAYLETKGLFSAWKKGTSFFSSHFMPILGLGMLLIGFQLFITLFLLYVTADLGARFAIVLLLFLLQQGVSISRVVMRGFGYQAIDNMMSKVKFRSQK